MNQITTKTGHSTSTEVRDAALDPATNLPLTPTNPMNTPLFGGGGVEGVDIMRLRGELPPISASTTDEPIELDPNIEKIIADRNRNWNDVQDQEPDCV